MSIPAAIWNFSREVVRELFAQARQLLAPVYKIDFADQDSATLVLTCSRRQLVVNRRYHTVKSGSKVLAVFDAIKSIDITHRAAFDETPECWTVDLKTGLLSGVRVGRTTDAVEASIVGARLSTFTGKPVRAL